MKTIYETNIVNRLAARIEEQTAGLYEGKSAIVVIDALPECPHQRYVRYRNQNQANECSVYRTAGPSGFRRFRPLPVVV